MNSTHPDASGGPHRDPPPLRSYLEGLLTAEKMARERPQATGAEIAEDLRKHAQLISGNAQR
jgi:hypothetical protein